MVTLLIKLLFVGYINAVNANLLVFQPLLAKECSIRSSFDPLVFVMLSS